MLAVQSPVALADVQDDTPTAAPLDAGPLAETAPPVLEERLGLTESAATELAAIEDATAPTDGPPQPPIDELQEAPSVAAPDIAVVEPTVPAAEETIAHGVTAAIEPVTEAPIAATAEQPVEAVLPAVAQTQEQAAEVLPPVPEPAVEQTAQGPAPTVEEPTAEAVTAPAPAPLPSTAPAATTAPLVAATPAPQPAATQKRRQGCVSELAKKRRPFCRDRLKAAGAGPTMVVLPAGEYTMGGSKSAEQPSRIVKIAYNFAMSVNEVTVAEFKKFCAETQRQCPEQPWNEGGYPVVNVSWNDAQAYGKWLSTQTGKLYRLPTEAEWEYSARAGTTSKYPFGDELLPTHARFAYSTTPESPLPKADRSINRNKFRLYHMVGNVREWVADSWAAGYQGAPADGSAREDASVATRVVRGGSYKDGADALRSAAREPLQTTSTDNVTGFRVVLDLTERSASDNTRSSIDDTWLAEQDRDKVTLQLFAVQNLDRVHSLMADHAEIPIRVLSANDETIRFRIVHGLFANADEARLAFNRLPADIVAQAKTPLVRSIRDLQQPSAP